MMAFREILMNAIEHGARFQPDKVVEVAAVHTARAIVFYVHDPGSGFSRETIPHAADRIPRTRPSSISNCANSRACGQADLGFWSPRGS